MQGSRIKLIVAGVVQAVLWLLVVPVVALMLMIYSARNEAYHAALTTDSTLRLALDNVNVISMAGSGVITDAQVLVSDGRITDVRTAGTATDATWVRIDANGAWMVPGLFDMHVHIHDRKYLELALARGFTSVRNIRGTPAHLRWKAELANHDWLGSNLYTSSPVISGDGADLNLYKVAADPEYARALVRRYKADGYDFIGIHASLGRPEFDAVMDEARLVNLDVAGPPPAALGAGDIAALGDMVTIEQAAQVFEGLLDSRTDQAALDDAAAAFAEQRLAVTPTLVNAEYRMRLAADKQAFVDSLPLQYLDRFYRYRETRTSLVPLLQADAATVARYREEKPRLAGLVRALQAHGVTLLAGSDAGTLLEAPGIASVQELHELHAAGLTPLQVLRAATVNAARVLGVDHMYGTIEPGKYADLVLYRANPLDDLAAIDKPYAVVKQGQWLDGAVLQQLEESAADTAGFFTAAGRFLEDALVRRAY